MRYPEGHKEQVRQRIVAQAAAAFRLRGLDGVSIPEVMKRAGLTHGAFYAHFADRDELVAEAVRVAAEATYASVFDPGRPLEHTLEHYLSQAHLQHPEKGCVVAALGCDALRQPTAVREVFAVAVQGMVASVQARLDRQSTQATQPSQPLCEEAGPAPAVHQASEQAAAAPSLGEASELCATVSDEALRLVAQMVGAVVLGRLVQDTALAARLLAATRVASGSAVISAPGSPVLSAPVAGPAPVFKATVGATSALPPDSVSSHSYSSSSG
jgi:TetR/AcrR family transcriptional regulator, transcriptional repressor for nem operon